MEYTKRRRYTVNVEIKDLQDVYQHDLQMYNFPPSGEIPFIEFQQLGMERLKLLQHLESIALKQEFKTLDERKQHLNAALIKDGLKYFAHLLYAKGCKSSEETDLQYRKKDHISHFVLRLSYCQDSDRQMWFINHEVDFFKLRFSSLDKEGVEKLLTMHNIDCEQITQQEKDEIREELRSSTFKNSNIDTIEFYKVPFQKVVDLVRSRKIYIAKGTAFIPQSDLISLFVSYFRKNLLEGMEQARFCVSNMYDDERLISFLKSLPGCFSGMTRVVWSTATTPIDKLDELSKISYPLCMRILHEALKANHHLKNSGRIQYGLFLKGIGVTLDDSLQFWRKEFSMKVDADKFDKQYSYALRHIYGKEGKQTNYTPLGCPKIICSTVGAGEYHGCPYRHMDSGSLQNKLLSYGMSVADVAEIVELANVGHYNIACATYFKIMHNQLPDKPIMHPNAYFAESRAILTKNDSTESETKDRFSQSGISTTPKMERTIGTPSWSASQSSRNTDRFSTPTRSIDRRGGTPFKSVERGGGTPFKSVERGGGTPTRITKAVPKRIDDLNMDEISELMEEDM
uniref:DNA primase large subunit-like n=1 Tax=Osmia lignaria TaxID=473952 RepID=UPI0014793B24|nr:DNA primase large subunit-like [Osmia lignaria]XP_034178644.1 DNA primase large subunit-like [Osmia lignaria]